MHGAYHVELAYPNDVKMTVADTFPNGIRFIGDEGWIFVARDTMTTPSDHGKAKGQLKFLDASDPKLLDPAGLSVHLPVSSEHHKNWLECVKSRADSAGARGHRAPQQHGVHRQLDRDEARPPAQLGREDRALRRRRRGELDAVPPGAQPLRHQAPGPGLNPPVNPYPNMNRRQFLSASAASLAAGALIPKGLSQASPATISGMNYAPKGKPNPVVKPGEFVFAAVRLDHGHIFGMCNGLTEAGATLKWVYDPDPKKVDDFRAKFPQAQAAAASMDEVLADPEVRLVAAAAVTSERGPLGCQVMEAGKDYFTDKAPFTTMEQLDQAKAVVARTGRKYYVYYSERLHNEAAMYATDLMEQGRHRPRDPGRLPRAAPPEQGDPARLVLPAREVRRHPLRHRQPPVRAVPHLLGDRPTPRSAMPPSGTSETPTTPSSRTSARRAWSATPAPSTTSASTGSPRTASAPGATAAPSSSGTKGYIELRKYVDVARDDTGDHVYLADEKGEHRFDVAGKVGFRFFGEFILDCLNRTEKSMTQAHAFKAAELSLLAQANAQRLTT